MLETIDRDLHASQPLLELVVSGYATAYALARPLADEGLAVAQLVLGVMYGGGHGVPQNHAEAANWLRRAADQGSPEAQTSRA